MKYTIQDELLNFGDVDLSDLLNWEVDLSNLITEGEKALVLFDLSDNTKSKKLTRT